MKALLLKDTFIIWKRLKMVLIMIAVFLLIEDMFIFALMMGMTTQLSLVSFDEQCKWDSYAKMLPYKTSEIVLSKYILTYGLVVAISLLGMIPVLIEYVCYLNLISGFTLYQVPIIFGT